MIDDDQDEASKKLWWEYNAARVGDSICLCKSWKAGYSLTSSNVWDDTSMKETKDKDFKCPDFQTIERQGIVSMGYDDVFDKSLKFPTEQWFWFSPRQVSKSKTSVTSSLPGKRLCLRPSKNIAPKVTPKEAVFFKGKARVKISWEEADFNTSRCGKEQAVTLVYTPKNKGNNYETITHNDYFLTLTDNTVKSTTFSLSMGTVSTEKKTEVDTFVCTEQNEQAFNVVETSEGNVWTVSWDKYKFEGAGCEKLHLDQNSFFVVRYEAVSVESGTVVQQDKKEGVETYRAELANPEDYGRRGVSATMTIELYYKESGGLINSITLQHYFCKDQAPVLSDSAIVVRGDTQCEEGEANKTVQLTFPSVTEWGRTCGASFVQQKRFYKPGKTEYDWTSSMTPESLECPDETATYTYSFGAFNGQSETNASVAITVCRMKKPAAPVNLTMVSDDPNLVIIGEDSSAGIFKWDYTDDSWGYCLASPTIQGSFIVGTKKEEQCTELGRVDSSIKEYSVDMGLEGKNTRKRVELCVNAIRGETEGPVASSSFDVCRITRPGIPVLVPLNGLVLGETEFTWNQPAYPGDDCTAVANQIKYKFVLVNSSGDEVHVLDDLVETTTGNVIVNQFNGQFKWSVTAYIANTPSLSTTSAKGTVSIGVCQATAPVAEDIESVKPAENESFSLESIDGSSVVALSWAAPDWGTLCGHHEPDQRTMSLVVEIENNGSWDYWENTSTFDNSVTRYALDLKVKQGLYRWTVNATISNSTSEPMTTTLINPRMFSVCLYSLPSIVFDCNESSYAVVDPNAWTVPLKYTVDGDLNTCNATYTVTMVGSVTANGKENNLDKVIVSTNENTGIPASPYVLNASFLSTTTGVVYGSFSVKSALLATSVETPSCEQKLCVPTSPNQLTLSLEEDIANMGTIKAEWINAAFDVAASGCWASQPIFDVILNYTATNGGKTIETTIVDVQGINETSLVLNNQPSGSYTVFVRGFNGFFWSDWSSSSIAMCRQESLKAATLDPPRNGATPWFQGVHFSFSNLPVAKESCSKLVSKLVYWKKENEDDRVERVLDAGETMFFAERLEPDVEYCWTVE